MKFNLYHTLCIVAVVLLEKSTQANMENLQAVQQLKQLTISSRKQLPYSVTAYGLIFKPQDAFLEHVVNYVHLHHSLYTLKGIPTSTHIPSSYSWLLQKIRRILPLSRQDTLIGLSAFLKKNEELILRQVVEAHDLPSSGIPVHVFFSADNGTYSGMHELGYIAAAMHYRTRLPMAQHGACVEALFGFFMRPDRTTSDPESRAQKPIPVLAVTTGIYSTRAAVCVDHILSLPMFNVQSVTFMGTAGVTPLVGGGGWAPLSFPHPSANGAPPVATAAPTQEELGNPRCQEEWDAQAQRVSLGSVCVTHAALLLECGYCVESTPVTSLCSRPSCSMRNQTEFFGTCDYVHPRQDFARLMREAMVGRPFPAVPLDVQRGMERFWAANDAVQKYRRVEARSADGEPTFEYMRAAPTAPILVNCAEAVNNQILAGPRSDVLCREYTHKLLNAGSNGTQGESYPMESLVCMQAMEGVGFLRVMQKHSHIPVAVVRAASNYNMYPLRKRVWSMETPPRNYVSWDQKQDFMPPRDYEIFMKASFRYAVETTSAVVLNYFLSENTTLPGSVSLRK